MIYVYFVCFLRGCNLIHLRAELKHKMGEIKSPSVTTILLHFLLVYKVGQTGAPVLKKKGLHQPSLCCFNTADLWASLAAKLQSPTEPCAYFLCPPLDHMEHEGHTDMVYHRFVSVCESVRLHVCVCVCTACLRNGPNLLASVCGFGSRVH